jgi:preprotein translocase subunit YajC
VLEFRASAITEVHSKEGNPVLINNAYAASAAAATPDFMSFIPLVVIFVLFWFMLIRPQMKQAKEQRNMITALQKGDEVTTNGGIVGKLTKVDESFVGLEIATGVVIFVQKQSIQTLLPKGTIKAL